jgi:stage III sporulation protein AG
MSEEKKPTKKFAFLDNLNFLKKLKQVKHIGLIIFIIFVLILLVILLGDFSFTSTSTTSSVSQSSTYTSSSEYVESVEKKLVAVLSKIKGAGSVSVMISTDGGASVSIAQNEEQKTVINGTESTTTTSSTPIIITQNGQEVPIIIGENLPTINGVVIVSSGAESVAVRLNLLSATQTLLNLSQDKIQIFVGN